MGEGTRTMAVRTAVGAGIRVVAMGEEMAGVEGTERV